MTRDNSFSCNFSCLYHEPDFIRSTQLLCQGISANAQNQDMEKSRCSQSGAFEPKRTNLVQRNNRDLPYCGYQLFSPPIFQKFLYNSGLNIAFVNSVTLETLQHIAIFRSAFFFSLDETATFLFFHFSFSWLSLLYVFRIYRFARMAIYSSKSVHA